LIKEALKNYINSGEFFDRYYHRDGGKISEVLSWEERTVYDGYCETCSYESTLLEIECRDLEGKKVTRTYDGTFAELMRALDRNTNE